MTEVTVFACQKELSRKTAAGAAIRIRIRLQPYQTNVIKSMRLQQPLSTFLHQFPNPVPESCYTVPLRLRQKSYTEALVTK